MFVVLSFFCFYIINIRFIIFEKQQRIKEMLGVFGVSNGVQWASRIVESTALLVPPLIAMAIIFRVSTYKPQTRHNTVS